MTIRKLKSKKRRSLRKKIIPAVLSIALAFACVMSMGFAYWNDTLTIDASVTVKKKPLDITNVTRSNAYTDVDLSSNDGYLYDDHSMYNHFMYSEYPRGTFEEWVCYQANYGSDNGNLLTYQIYADWSDGIFTIYNHELNRDAGKRNFMGAIKRGTAADGSYGLFAWNLQASADGSEVSFSGRYPLDESSYNRRSLIDPYGRGFYGVSGIPIAVTLKNPNTSSVKITNVTFLDKNENTPIDTIATCTDRPNIGGGQSATLIINPVRVGDNKQYTSFTAVITDENDNEYRIPVQIQKIPASGSGSLMMAPPRPNMASAPTTTTTEETTTTTTTTTRPPMMLNSPKPTTTTSAEDTATTTTTAPASTTASTDAESTTSTAAATTTTTTAAPETTTSTAAETTTTTTTTAATTTTTTTTTVATTTTTEETTTTTTTTTTTQPSDNT